MKDAILDANILFPADLRNTFMYLTLAGAFTARRKFTKNEFVTS